jgi:hypothetical protein
MGKICGTHGRDDKYTIPWSKALPGKSIVAQQVKQLPSFYGTEASSLCSQEPKIGTHPETDVSSQYFSIPFLEEPF